MRGGGGGGEEDSRKDALLSCLGFSDVSCEAHRNNDGHKLLVCAQRREFRSSELVLTQRPTAQRFGACCGQGLQNIALPRRCGAHL